MVATTSPVDAALAYAGRGWRVVPIKPGQKRPPMDAWQDAATTDPQLIREWWTRWASHGVGIVTGEHSGIWVLDVDVSDGKAGDDTLADLTATHGPLPDTVETITGSGGRHLYFAWPGWNPGTGAGRLGPGLDIRAEGGQVLAPPTVHPNGRPYEWEASAATTVAPAPPWLLELLRTPPDATQARRAPAPRPIGGTPGDRWAATVTWPQLLEADGATFLGARTDHRTHTTYELWARPGVTDHAGATLYYGGTDVLKVFTSSWPGLTQDQTYTRFGYLAATRHHGDHSAAASVLAHLEGEQAVVSLIDAHREPEPSFQPLIRGDEVAAAPTVEPPRWQRADLATLLAEGYEPPHPTLLARADGAFLLYPQRINALMGASGAGKSWVALVAAAAELLAGNTVVYIDLEDHPRSIADRLRALSVPLQVIIERLAYYQPEAPADVATLEHIDRLVTSTRATMLVIDSVGEAMALQGMKQNDDDEVARWYRLVARRWAGLGPAVVLIDHIPKDPDGPRLFAIGSQRKRAAVDGAMYRIDQVRAFSRDQAGLMTIVCAKDRNGTWPVGAKVAEAHVEPTDGGRIIDIRLETPPGVDEEGHVFRPTFLMERVSRVLELAPEPMTKKAIEDNVTGKAKALRQALEVLVAEGYVEALAGPRNATLHQSTRPFRETSEALHALIGDPSDTAAPTAPGPVGHGPAHPLATAPATTHSENGEVQLDLTTPPRPTSSPPRPPVRDEVAEGGPPRPSRGGSGGGPTGTRSQAAERTAPEPSTPSPPDDDIERPPPTDDHNERWSPDVLGDIARQAWDTITATLHAAGDWYAEPTLITTAATAISARGIPHATERKTASAVLDAAWAAGWLQRRGSRNAGRRYQLNPNPPGDPT